MAQQEHKMLSTKLFKFKEMVFPVDERNVFAEDCIDSIMDFEIRNNDLFVITFPKSGTVWMQRIITLLYEEDFPENVDQMTIFQMPWLEFRLKGIDYNSNPSPRLFSSHLHEPMVPKGLKQKGKIINLMRNPKDIMVSYFHFSKHKQDIDTWESTDEMLNNFFTGRMLGGCWFDHVRGWVTNKDKYNILFLTYEEMIKDLRSVIVKICEFVGKNLSDAAIDNVVERASFNDMKKDPTANYEFLSEEITDRPKGLFLRKGTVGDWKNSLTVAQSEHFDRVYQERMKDLPLNFMWDISDKKSKIL